MKDVSESSDWNSLIAALPGAHILQTREWALVKAAYGWIPTPKIWHDPDGQIVAAAMVLERTIRLGGFSSMLRILYIPRGPVMDWRDEVLRIRVVHDLQCLAQKRRAIFIKIDPEIITGTGIPGSEEAYSDPTGLACKDYLQTNGWRLSNDQIQFRNTVWLDLEGQEDDWLARMKQKTRYNLRLAQRKGVTVRIGNLDDIGMIYKMYAETSLRDGFVIRSEDYYHKVWSDFVKAGMAEILIAEVGGQPVAGLILFNFAGRAWYLYGMSREAHREKMPNYLLQWEAMKRAKNYGCSHYDLWGAPDVFDASDDMWGVYRFKEGLGGKVIRTIGAWDFAEQPWIYNLYTQFLPRVLDLMRRKGRQRVQREVS
jgi:peptidoglycan pentaglycine glycine transferase (the first glycine)